MRLWLARLSQPPPTAAKEAGGWWEFALKSVIAPGVLLLVGFGFGIATELFKEASAEEKIFLEQRMKIFVQTGEHFETYRLNWSRLIDFANWEWEQRKKGQTLSPAELARRDKYVAARDTSKEQLFAQFRATRLFFGPEVAKRVDAFRAFDAEQSIRTVDKLAPISAWDAHQNALLDQMRVEVRRK
jgi:hypothetical protein